MIDTRVDRLRLLAVPNTPSNRRSRVAGDFIDDLRASGLTGRGGAGFPTWRKWSAVAEHSSNRSSVVVANGSEGEPASHKDRYLMRVRPDLVIDGLLVAADTLRARTRLIYLPRRFEAESAALQAALERRADVNRRGEPEVRIVRGPHRYVAGESSAVVGYLNGGEARPRFTLRRTAESGVEGLPTLVQNVETLAHIGLIARNGPRWFREAGSESEPGTALVTVIAAGTQPKVQEVGLGTSLAEVAQRAGIEAPFGPVLVGGYFGGWLPGAVAESVRLDSRSLKEAGSAFGCGSLVFLPRGACVLHETAAVLRFLAAESARQCGPCWNGLDTIADRFTALAEGRASAEDVDRLTRLADALSGRGACNHPEGALAILRSCLRHFTNDVERHLAEQPCVLRPLEQVLPTPAMDPGWR